MGFLQSYAGAVEVFGAVVVVVVVVVVVLFPVEVDVVVALVVDVPEVSGGGPHLVKSDLSAGKGILASRSCWLMHDS